MKTKIVASADLTVALAKRVAETAAKHLSDVRLLYRDKGANAKSLMGVIALSFKKGADLYLVAEVKKYKTHAEIIEALKTLDYINCIEEIN